MGAEVNKGDGELMKEGASIWRAEGNTTPSLASGGRGRTEKCRETMEMVGKGGGVGKEGN